VLFVFREEYYLQNDAPVRRAEDNDANYRNRFTQWQDNLAKARGLAELIITKNRHGETSTVNVRFDAARTRFEDLSRREVQ
jgi:replicative DNA helicase